MNSGAWRLGNAMLDAIVICKHCYHCKLMNLEVVNVVACTINIIKTIIDDTVFLNDVLRVINYVP
jgi:hypothetical protein